MSDCGAAEKLFHLLSVNKLSFATAESLTCGLIAAKMGEVPGVSGVYEGGFVTYSPEMKMSALGVSGETIRKYGTVSRECAAEMCAGAAERSGADAAVSATGNAGPDASEGKPVGLVYIGICIDGKTVGKKYMFTGGREEIRAQAVDAALTLLYGKLSGKGSDE